MNRLAFLTASILLSGSAEAAPDLPGGSRLSARLTDGPFAGPPDAAALDWTRARAATLSLQAGDALVASSQTRWRGRVRVRLNQTHHGIPVEGGVVIVDILPDGRVDAATVSLRRGLQVDPVPTVSRQQAEFDARAAAPVGTTVIRTDLMVLPIGSGALAWRVHLRGERPIDAWQVAVDAHTGKVRRFESDGVHASGRVFATKAEDDDLAVVDLEELEPDAVALDGEHVTTYSLVFDEAGTPSYAQHAVADEAGDFLYEPDHPDPDDAFIEVNTYFHAQQTRRFFEETFDHPVPNRVVVHANYRTSPDEGYDNAFFTYGQGGQYVLTFGQGAEMDWGYDPGIIIHEFSHGIVEDLSHLLETSTYPFNLDEYGMNPAPGGLTEGLPDYWSVTRTGRSDQGAFADGTPIRDLDNDATCPESVLGEAHADGEVIGGTTWELRVALGAELTDDIVYGATALLPPAPSYAEFSEAMQAAAAAMQADGALGADQVDALTAILDARGITRCGRSIPVTDQEPSTSTFLGVDIVDESFCTLVRNGGVQITTPFQYAVTVPEQDGQVVTAITLELDMQPLQGGAFEDDDLQYTVHATSDGLVHYLVEELEVLGYTFPLPTESDNALATWEDSPAEVVLTAESAGLDALVPGSTWTFSLVGMNCRTARTTVSVDFTWRDAPVATGSAELRGCIGLADSRALVLPLAGLALFGLRRRRPSPNGLS